MTNHKGNGNEGLIYIIQYVYEPDFPFFHLKLSNKIGRSNFMFAQINLDQILDQEHVSYRDTGLMDPYLQKKEFIRNPSLWPPEYVHKCLFLHSMYSSKLLNAKRKQKKQTIGWGGWECFVALSRHLANRE
jgi:hypothetical protein